MDWLLIRLPDGSQRKVPTLIQCPVYGHGSPSLPLMYLHFTPVWIIICSIIRLNLPARFLHPGIPIGWGVIAAIFQYHRSQNQVLARMLDSRVFVQQFLTGQQACMCIGSGTDVLLNGIRNLTVVRRQIQKFCHIGFLIEDHHPRQRPSSAAGAAPCST